MTSVILKMVVAGILLALNNYIPPTQLGHWVQQHGLSFFTLSHVDRPLKHESSKRPI